MSFHLDGRGEFDENYKAKPKVLAEINMTPFVDVCLVLLIIFMVTAPFAISGINVRVPETKAKPLAMSNESLILSVTPNGEFYLGKNKVAENDLVVKIKTAAGGKEKFPIFIRADKDVPYGKVMIAMAAAQNAGVERIGMIGQNKQNKK
jgi:biopolymer transport protein TolR